MARFNPGLHLATHVIKHHNTVYPFEHKKESKAERDARNKKETIIASLVGGGIVLAFIGMGVAMELLL